MQVTKIRSLVSRDGSMIGLFNMDMVFIAGVPHAVFEWSREPGGEAEPTIVVALDPRFLERLPAGGEITHQYRVSVEDPRPVE